MCGPMIVIALVLILFLLDLHKLGLWEPLHALVTAEKSTPNIQVHALWVIGTAVQHNPIAQDVVSVPRCQREFSEKSCQYLSLRPFPVLVSLLDVSFCPHTAVRAKVLYVLSGLLRHNVHAVKDFGAREVNGWPRLCGSLKGASLMSLDVHQVRL
jgi:hypothetical protein